MNRRADLAGHLTDDAHDGTQTPARVARAFGLIARMFEHDPRTGRAMVRAWLQAGGPLLSPASETSNMLADLVRAGQQRGEVALRVDADRAGLVLFDAYLGALYRWALREETEPDLESDLVATLDVLLRGIAA